MRDFDHLETGYTSVDRRKGAHRFYRDWRAPELMLMVASVMIHDRSPSGRPAQRAGLELLRYTELGMR